LVSAPALGAGDRGFKSHRPDRKSVLAQVSGLSPTGWVRRQAELTPVKAAYGGAQRSVTP
jgi:hypothetical protein